MPGANPVEKQGEIGIVPISSPHRFIIKTDVDMETNDTIHCLNCGQQLQGAFCHACGQQGRINVHLTFSELARDFLGDMFTYDSRLYRTIVPLLIRPGFLTQEFFKGRRVPYVPPLRLFLFISFLLFFWFAMVDTGIVNFSDSQSTSNQAAEQVQPAENTGSDTPSQLQAAQQTLKQKINLIAQNPTPFMNLMESRLPYLMFLMVPIFAVILWLHYALSGFNYFQHLVFVLHYQSFIYVVTFLLTASNKVLPWDLGLLALLAMNVYLGVALHKVYGSGIAGCIFKTFSILFWYAITLATGVGVFLLLNMLSYG